MVKDTGFLEEDTMFGGTSGKPEPTGEQHTAEFPLKKLMLACMAIVICLLVGAYFIGYDGQAKQVTNLNKQVAALTQQSASQAAQIKRLQAENSGLQAAIGKLAGAKRASPAKKRTVRRLKGR